MKQNSVNNEKIQEWVEQFDEDGFLFLEEVLPKTLVAELKEDLERVLRDGDYKDNARIRLKARMFENSPSNLRLFDLEPMVSFAEAVLGDSCHVMHNNSFETPPGGGITEWHQDDPPRTFQWKDLGLTIFRRYWPNPAPGIPQAPGVFHSFRVADVEFFMLDDRYNRDPRRAKDRSTMLGSIELQWLKERLRTSTATFKVIANGGTIVVDEGKETWDLYGPERDGFLEWMFAEGINGVLFIAGDWQPRSGAVIVFRLTLHVSNSSSE